MARQDGSSQNFEILLDQVVAPNSSNDKVQHINSCPTKALLASASLREAEAGGSTLTVAGESRRKMGSSKSLQQAAQKADIAMVYAKRSHPLL